MRSQISCLNEVEFTFPSRSGPKLEVMASGKVIARDFFQDVTVKGLEVRVYQYANADDLDGKELLQSDIPELWDQIEHVAVNKLCRDEGADA